MRTDLLTGIIKKYILSIPSAHEQYPNSISYENSNPDSRQGKAKKDYSQLDSFTLRGLTADDSAANLLYILSSRESDLFLIYNQGSGVLKDITMANPILESFHQKYGLEYAVYNISSHRFIFSFIQGITTFFVDYDIQSRRSSKLDSLDNLGRQEWSEQDLTWLDHYRIRTNGPGVYSYWRDSIWSDSTYYKDWKKDYHSAFPFAAYIDILSSSDTRFCFGSGYNLDSSDGKWHKDRIMARGDSTAGNWQLMPMLLEHEDRAFPKRQMWLTWSFILGIVILIGGAIYAYIKDKEILKMIQMIKDRADVALIDDRPIGGDKKE